LGKGEHTSPGGRSGTQSSKKPIRVRPRRTEPQHEVQRSARRDALDAGGEVLEGDAGGDPRRLRAVTKPTCRGHRRSANARWRWRSTCGCRSRRLCQRRRSLGRCRNRGSHCTGCRARPSIATPRRPGRSGLTGRSEVDGSGAGQRGSAGDRLSSGRRRGEGSDCEWQWRPAWRWSWRPPCRSGCGRRRRRSLQRHRSSR
jgi:hypothetical protein